MDQRHASDRDANAKSRQSNIAFDSVQCPAQEAQLLNSKCQMEKHEGDNQAFVVKGFAHQQQNNEQSGTSSHTNSIVHRRSLKLEEFTSKNQSGDAGFSSKGGKGEAPRRDPFSNNEANALQDSVNKIVQEL